MELRCDGNILHAIVVGEGSGIVEVRCRSKFCGRTAGVVVLHRFDLSTGEATTRQYQEPPQPGRSKNGLGEPHAALRVP
jgi:hypothetical protein